MARIETTVTYLEMSEPGALVGFETDDSRVSIVEVRGCTVAFYRFLYSTVGKQYHWVERNRWSDERLAAHLADPAVSLSVLLYDGCPAGYFELYREGDSIEIAYFGLMPEFLGKRLGKHLLTAATKAAWSLDPRRVWLHTCTLDAPQALPNYIARGFRPYKTDTEVIETA
jgi:GNAT superfamily N-acetyltransferase